jgi:hypothetical protein
MARRENPTVQISARLPEDLIIRVKLEIVRQRTTLREVVRRALEDWLHRQKKEAR